VADGYLDGPHEHALARKHSGATGDESPAEIFNAELNWLLVNQYGAFNSPVWFNVGLHHKYGIGEGGS